MSLHRLLGIAAVAAGLLAVVALSSAFGDVLPPDHKGVKHDVFVVGTGNFPAHRFFVFPTSFNGGFVEVSDEPIRFYHLASPRIVAVPVDQMPDELTDEFFRSEDRIFSTVVLQAFGSVPAWDPTAHVVSMYDIVDVTADGQLIVDRHPDQFYDADGNPIDPNQPFPLPFSGPANAPSSALMVIVGIAVVGFVLILVIAIWFRPKTQSSTA